MSPKVGLVMLKKTFESKLKKKVPEYSITYYTNTEELFFVIDGDRYPYKNKMIVGLIMSKFAILENEYNATIDYVVILYKDDKVPYADVYMRTEKHEQIHIKQLL